MAKGFKQGAGGANPLNFKVVGNPQPTNPKENTIWVETNVDITGWIFSATEPEAPADGKDGPVWITTGASSPVEFNALKKNGIRVYPLSAKQYVGGAWVDTTAKSWQGGEWVEWVTYLYNNGYECTSITGGWEISKNCDGTITKNADSVTFDIKGKSASNTYGVIYTVDPVDLTNISTLKINPDWVVSISNSVGTHPSFGVSTEKPNSYAIVSSPTACISDGEALDVSTISDKHYVFVGAYLNGMSSYTAKIKLTEVLTE